MVTKCDVVPGFMEYFDDLSQDGRAQVWGVTFPYEQTLSGDAPNAFAPEFADILEHHRRIFNYEAARNYAYEYEEHHDQVSQVLRDTVLTPGRELPLDAYVEAIETAEAFSRHLDDIFAGIDVLLTPSAAGEAPEGLGSTGDPSFNSIWTLAWTPCVTLPAGTGPKGLPLGIQLIGPRFADEKLLDRAAWVEARLSST